MVDALSNPDLQKLAVACCEIARAAGREILEVYGRSEIASTAKQDSSPLTEADLRAHRVIIAKLAQLTPTIPVLSEEAADVAYDERKTWSKFWLVDPLDGTKEFLSRNDEFTVNIALVEGMAPLLGVVHVPALSETYWGLGSASVAPQAWRLRGLGDAEPISVSRRRTSLPRVLASRSHRGDTLDRFLARLGEHEIVSAGSALKFCRLAEGRADVYPRLGPTSEWDTAAGQAVVEGAGGVVVTLDGQALAYNCKTDLLNPSFVAYADRMTDWLSLLSK
jgi:3'(2'), 5'-bisphosphate nucleotidase